nr:MAG TPA: hypothetical protein [Bacteriophage sp.]
MSEREGKSPPLNIRIHFFLLIVKTKGVYLKMEIVLNVISILLDVLIIAIVLRRWK